MPTPVQRTLTWDDIEEAAKKGVERNVNAHSYQGRGRIPRFIPKYDEEQWQGNIRGMIGEMVITRWFGWPFNPEVNKPDTEAGDVGKLQVRMWFTEELHIWPRDREGKVFALVTGTLPLNGQNPVYFVWGWLKPEIVRAIGMPSIDKATGKHRGHYLHARDLQDPNELYQHRDYFKPDLADW